MCGIFALLNNTSTLNPEDVKMAFELGNNRGPEDSEFIKYDNSIDIGFKRLAINGLNKLSRQPMTIDNITLICNGEIYNYKELFKEINVTPTTQSDCEIIIHLYKKYGIRHTLMLLDGYFAFILYDYRTENSEPQFIVARDPFGVRPLFILEQNHIQDENKHNNNHITHENIIGFASELKMLNPLLNSKKGLLTYSKPTIPYPKQVTGIKPSFTISQYPPGCYSVYKISYSLNSEWINDVKNVSYHYQRHIKNIATNSYSKEINNAVKKRVKGTTERPIACLLSGGLDSSLITALVNKYHEGQLDTFSIGMEGSEDLKYAKEVANYLNTNHTEIVLTPDEFFDAIPDVIRTIESYDTTTVRASVGNYLVGKYISENTDIKVVFNGDGSD
jgi:asparagine synthase (glutamine-hydrolysing)